jgi:hydroxymethylpyrimidine pyrophosphatase-like HAD family hydrolase
LGRRIPGLVLQEPEFQSPFKVSFYITSKQKMYDLKQLLDNNYLRVKAIYSCGKYLDIIPVNGGKRKAINYLSQVWKIDPSNILTCGDSGNDLDMLCNPKTHNIAVGNAREEIAALRHTGLFYRAVSRFASGLLEGAEAFGFWPDTKNHRRSYGSLNI